MSDHLIDAIYEAPLVPAGWRKALLQVADTFGATDAALYASDERGTTLQSAVSGRLPHAVHQTYFDDFVDRDTQILRLLQLKEDQDITGLDLLDDESAQPCPVHHEYLVPHRISSQIVWLLNGTGQRKYTLALMRAESHGPFDSSIRHRFGKVARHIKRSIRVNSGLKAVQEESINNDVVLSMSGIGLALIEEDGGLRARNDYARALFYRSAALRNALKVGFRKSELDYWRQLETPVFQLNVFDPDLRTQFEICLHRRHRSNASMFDKNTQSGALCMIRVGQISVEQHGTIWRHRFGLTETEVELAHHLLNGDCLNSFAKQRDRSVHTARNQLKSLQSKANSRSQIELVTVLRDALDPIALNDLLS